MFLWSNFRYKLFLKYWVKYYLATNDVDDERWFERELIDFQKYKKMPIKLKFLKVTDSQVDLWIHHTTNADKYEFWFNKFNTQDRIRLWNSLDLPFVYFEKLQSQKQWNEKFVIEFQSVIEKKKEFKFHHFLELLDYEEVQSLAEIVIQGRIGDQHRIVNLLDINKKENKFKYITNETKSMNDNRTHLWIPLSIKDKLRMFINQRNQNESILMQMMM